MTLKKKAAGCLIIAGMLMMLAGCSGKEPQTATIRLPANPTTGYEWQVTQEPEIFDISSEYVEGETEDGAVGAGGTQVYILTPKQKGTAEVSFVYARPWEEDAEPDSELHYTIKVSGGMQLEVQTFAGSLPGDMETVPDVPTLTIE